MTGMPQDLRYAFRQLRKNPGFAAVALITLALCIGSNLTIFAVVDSILLRPLPFPESGRLVILYNSYPNAGKNRDLTSLTSYYERRGQISAFSGLASLNEVTSVLGDTGSTERVEVGRVTPEFFDVLGVRPTMGRAFTESEMTYQSDHEAILTDTYWRQHFNADPNVLGGDIRSDGLSRRIVGVLPPGFTFLSSRAQVFMPLSSEDGERNLGARHSNKMIQIARLRPGSSLAEAQAEVDAQNAAHAAEFPFAKEVAAAGYRTMVAPLHADHVASVRPSLLLLQAGALFLLLIGGVNLVNLLLIRASSRIKELAVRQSMGASRSRVLAQVMTETVVLTSLGGICGLAVGAAGIRLVEIFGASQLPLGAQIALDARLAGAGLFGSVLFGIFLAIPISWFNLSNHLASALQSESRSGTTGRSAQRLRHSFIVAQITVAFVLLTGAWLLGMSLRRVAAISPGFRADHILTGQFGLPWSSYQTGPSFLHFFDPVMDSISHQPGVEAAGVITGVPLTGDHGGDAISAVGYKPAPGESVVLHPTYGVFGNYFEAMGIPLFEGRYLGTSDSHRNDRVCVVDEEFARRYWPGGNAVGQQIFTIPRKADDSNVFTVVGVVGTVKESDLTENKNNGSVYFPFMFTFSRSYFIAVRTSFPPESFSTTLSKLVRQADPDLPLNDLQTMEGRIDDSLMVRRSPALLTAIFACMALLLAGIGTYGVLSYSVAQRHREIGVRMALGALPKRVIIDFLRLGAKLLLSGLALGVLGAWAAGRAMQSMLFGVGTFPAVVLATTASVMIFVVLLACIIPARRAARVDPMVALRYE
jgi:predicted permease